MGTSPQEVAAEVSSRITAALARAMAITSTVALVSAATAAICSCPPRTGMPRIRRCRLAGSSSSSATGWYSESRWPASRWTSWVPALPAPKMMTFAAGISGAGRRCRAARDTYRAPSMATSAKIAASASVRNGAR